MKSYFLFFLFIITFVYTQECLEEFFFNLVKTNGTFHELTWDTHPHFFNDHRLITYRKDNIERLVNQWEHYDEQKYNWIEPFLLTYNQRGFVVSNGTAELLDDIIQWNSVIGTRFKKKLNFENMTIIDHDNISLYFRKRYFENKKI